MTGSAGSLPVLAFVFRCIPEKERRLPAAGCRHRSGVRFPLYSGKGTPVGLGVAGSTGGS
jgi:hypothetical protein